MKKKSALFALTLTALLGFNLSTKAQFILSGELRPRAEYRHGFKSPATEDMDAALFVSQRTRLNMSYKNEKMKFGLSLQDVRVWGNVPQQNISDNSYTLHEAWGEYFFTPEFSVKAGRMELIYDDSRLFGNVDWAQQGRSHDIGLLKFENAKWKAHAGLAYNQDKEQLSGRVYTIEGNYKNLQLIYLSRKWEKLEASAIFVNNGMQYFEEENEQTATDTKYTQTFGGNVSYKTKPVILAAGFYKQGGTNTADKKVNAFMFGANATFSFGESFSVNPGIEFHSGTSQKDAPAGESNSFNPLYGTAHKFNGHMDYFFAGNHFNTVGLQDIFLKGLYKQNKFSAGIDFHLFSAPADILDPADNSQTLSSNLGQEADLYIGYKLSPEVTFSMGYSQYFTTASLIALKGGSNDKTSNWAWASVIFKPVFLNTGK